MKNFVFFTLSSPTIAGENKKPTPTPKELAKQPIVILINFSFSSNQSFAIPL